MLISRCWLCCSWYSQRTSQNPKPKPFKILTGEVKPETQNSLYIAPLSIPVSSLLSWNDAKWDLNRSDPRMLQKPCSHPNPSLETRKLFKPQRIFRRIVYSGVLVTAEKSIPGVTKPSWFQKTSTLHDPQSYWRITSRVVGTLKKVTIPHFHSYPPHECTWLSGNLTKQGSNPKPK